jgi:aspartate kinase
MALIVQKFGGTSLANPERINAVAERVAKYHKEGNQIIVVVSAMSGETNKLVSLAEEMMEDPEPKRA